MPKWCKIPPMLSPQQSRFLAGRRVGHLATADARAAPHLVPVCFVVGGDTLYITIDQKPKGDVAGAEALAEHRRKPGRRLRRRPLGRGLDPARLGHAARAGGDPRRRRGARSRAGPAARRAIPNIGRWRSTTSRSSRCASSAPLAGATSPPIAENPIANGRSDEQPRSDPLFRRPAALDPAAGARRSPWSAPRPTGTGRATSS